MKDMNNKIKTKLALVVVTALIGAPGLLSAQGFVLVQSMPHARVGHTATLLKNGTVVVVGGVADGSDGKSTILYRPLAYSWSPLNPANEARWHHTANLLSDGRVLVAGGSDPITLISSASAEIFSVTSRAWTLTASMTESRQFHTATLLPGGKILVTGGVGDDSAAKVSAEIYDPATSTWSLTGSMNTARARHSATRLPDGEVLITGGDSGDGQTFYTSAELYDPATGNWSYTNNTLFRGNASAVLLETGDVLVGGVRSAAIYSPRRQRFIPTGEPVLDWGNERLTSLLDGRALMTGGIDTDGTISDRWQLYDPSSRTWVIYVPYPMSWAHAGHTSTLLLDGTVLIVGGLGYDGTATGVTDLFRPY